MMPKKFVVLEKFVLSSLPFITFSYPIIHSTVGDDKITRKFLAYPKKIIRTLEIILDLFLFIISPLNIYLQFINCLQ